MSAEWRAGNNGRRVVSVVTAILLLFIFSPFFPRETGAGQDEPSAVIRTLNTTLLEAMKKAKELGYSGRYTLLEPVVKESFSLSFMGSQSVGRYWRTMGAEERSLFLKTYTEWTIATYAGRFDGYSGETFHVASESAPVKGTVTVVSRFRQSNDEVIDFSYLLRRIEDKWRIVDIRISGVSQLALTRAQFTGILREKGVGALISSLREKIRRFARNKEE